MKIFLMWKHLRSNFVEPDPVTVGRRLKEVFVPLFEDLPACELISFPSAKLAILDMPIKGFTALGRQEDEQTWAYAPQYPLNISTALSELGIKSHNKAALPALARTLESTPYKALTRLASPFSLIWSPKDSGDVLVQTDGLGHALLYEYRDENFWALSNRPFAFSALGIGLVPDAEAWAVRSVLGWFPGTLTGFHNMRYLEPGTQVRVTRSEISHLKYDVLTEWITHSSDSVESCLELAQSSLINLVRSAKHFLENPVASLSGGWDSRAVASVFMAEGIKFTAKVRGPAEHPDVVIAHQLANVAGLEIKSSYEAGIPPLDPETCKENILLALLWQSGGRNAHQHKSFQCDGRFRNGGSVGISGQHGEIGRSHYIPVVRKASLPIDGRDDTLLQFLTRRAPEFIRAPMRDRAFDIIREAIAQADHYGLKGKKRWDFFYLYERTRRWAAAAQAGKPGFSITPFLNPDYIKASFSYPGKDMTDNPFHRHIVRNLMPAWNQIPYANEIVPQDAGDKERDSEELGKLPRWQKMGRRRFYDTKLYWEDVGQPILMEVIAKDGFWCEIFDPDLTQKFWKTEPDELSVVCLLPQVITRLDRKGG